MKWVCVNKSVICEIGLVYIIIIIKKKSFYSAGSTCQRSETKMWKYWFSVVANQWERIGTKRVVIL